MRFRFLVFMQAICLAGCGTYYDPTDNYVRGLRWFDRGDYATAAEIWKPMAEAGDCDAQYRYGHLLWLGLGVKMDRPAARSLWERAANGGQAKAQIAMGNLALNAPHNVYLCREGCTPDAVEAYKWYLLAGKNAHYPGEREELSLSLADIKGRLSPAQMSEGERLSAAWTPSPKACNPRNLL